MNPMEPASVATDHVVNGHMPAMHHDPASARLDLAAWDALHREQRHAAHERSAHFYTAGRLILAAMFLVMAYAKATHFANTVAAVKAAGVGDGTFLVGFAMAVELTGGLLLALGWKVRITAGTLIGYLVLVTVVVTLAQSLAVTSAVAIANLGFIGGLLFLTAYGAGGGSLEGYLAKQRGRASRG
jgi:putative oxidoreductase